MYKTYWQLFYDKGNFNANYEFFKNAKSFWGLEMVYEDSLVYIVKRTNEREKAVVYTIHFDFKSSNIEQIIFQALRHTIRMKKQDEETIKKAIKNEVADFKTVKSRTNIQDFYSYPYRIIEERSKDKNGR